MAKIERFEFDSQGTKMTNEEKLKPKGKQKAVIKAFILAVFIIAAIYVVRYTPVKEFLTVGKMKQFLDASGLWAPVIFILIYTLAICLFVPGTIITALGAAIFGAYRGFVYVLAGAMLGATVTFFIGRYMGRDFAASVIGDRLKKYDEAIEKNGFATVLYLRLIYFPFTAMDFGMGLTRVRFWDYFWGTALGILVGTFVFTFFVGTIKEVWASGDWGQLLSGKVFFSIALFIFSLFIPKIVNRFKKE
jgi:uncharacterized membrane protein YdjX (TVP38/TMEM64 family)